MEKETIHFILTGGTIDSYYDAPNDTVKPFKKSVLPDYLKGLKLNTKLVFTEVCMKDSRQINSEDRKNIAEIIEKSPEKRFIITHGTYTMPDTARHLEANLKRKDATVIFTGSMAPIDFPKTDSTFNLGYSLAEIQNLNHGIYICMNGKIFSPKETIKLVAEGIFVSIFSDKKKN
ncbi:MAG TPA: asparaginase domain-containing protein [archaeon]|nr:asparaginase domain-containing protein [archaeon]